MSSKDRYECIILDFGGVISLPQREGFFSEIGAELGVDPDALAEGYRRYREDYDRGVLRGIPYWRRVLEACDRRGEDEELERLIERDTAGWTVINTEVREAVSALARRGARLAVLSNMPWEIGLYLRRTQPWLERSFDEILFSCEVGLVKPEPEIYRVLLDRLGLPASACVFLDDTEHNVEGARNVGLDAVLFRGPEDLLALGLDHWLDEADEVDRE